MTLRFGTDGIRGDAATDLTPELVVALGRAAARVLGGAAPFVVGRDTRASGARIEDDLARGLAAEGATARRVGVLPTPGVAFLAQRDGAPAAMISASHNPWSDNGIKLFAAGGRKLPDDAEAAVEAELGRLVEDPAPAPPPGPDLDGPAGGPDDPEADDPEPDDADARAAYRDHLVGALGGRRLDGVQVVLDCAHGAASRVGPEALRAAGAGVDVLHDTPDGRNINAGCGSTDTAALRAAVVEQSATAGLALDGDADRVVAVDEQGRVVDGDQIIAALAIDLHERGSLAGGAVAVTVMSNLGLRRALESAGIEVVETPVGDRHVLAALEARGLVLGGEQSGHVIRRDLATTGDGLLTGLLLLDLVRRTGRPLSALAAAMRRLPQVLVNVPVEGRVDLDTAPAALADAVRAEGDRLGRDGRVLLRASGTEPVVRVMVEAPTDDTARAVADRLAAAVAAHLGPAGAEV